MQYKKAKSSIKKKRGKASADKKVAAFFGKLPNIEDGLTYQKKVRSEWK
ncbi:MAG: hypothetical protein HYR66_02285 [Sphingobacteriales bacterium]|nr:hypothetical protein [Sphingobacteriales bacterium]MBI3717080.1 hypothetical protein [Sphingobacteriales bacterium]